MSNQPGERVHGIGDDQRPSGPLPVDPDEAFMEAIAQARRTEVWLAERAGISAGSHVYGIFSSQSKAEQVCQDVANQYFGAAHTPPLKWLRQGPGGGFSSAAYYQPGGTNYTFMVTRFTVDEEHTDE